MVSIYQSMILNVWSDLHLETAEITGMGNAGFMLDKNSTI